MVKRNKYKKQCLPSEFKKYFWDVDFNRLSIRRYSIFILERIMSLGDLDALKWLLKIPKKKILEVIGRSREIDPKTRNFWQVVYGK